MATKSRRKTTRRKTTKKRNYSKKRQQNFDYKIITGLIAEIFLAIGAFRLGLVGNFLADIYKYVFGVFILFIFILLIAVFFRLLAALSAKTKDSTAFLLGFLFVCDPIFGNKFIAFSSQFFRR
ncbi:hypothetical protein Q757_08605 [Oenococcus alcoholitolerans]|uniref:Uncharacterized protein n=1 Tax=Oenococcus alcoholitolerans TaxID=931074 RepID=A0ABR4XPE0_9LACO|nr:hypothetical protein Q757_08605 [Oenococcus alcoholitolerans]